MSEQPTSPPLLLVATLWHLIRAVDDKEPGLVEIIKSFVYGDQFTLSGFTQTHDTEHDGYGYFESSKITLCLFFSLGSHICSFTVISCYKSYEWDGRSDGGHEVTEYSLEFETELPDDLVKPSGEQPVRLYAPKEVDRYFTYGQKSFDLTDGLKVIGEDGIPYYLVKIDDYGEMFSHCILLLQGSIELDPCYYESRVDTYSLQPL
jgi:hypothetical protein